MLGSWRLCNKSLSFTRFYCSANIGCLTVPRKLSRREIAGIWCLLNSNDANVKRNREDDYKGTSYAKDMNKVEPNDASANACAMPHIAECKLVHTHICTIFEVFFYSILIAHNNVNKSALVSWLVKAEVQQFALNVNLVSFSGISP